MLKLKKLNIKKHILKRLYSTIRTLSKLAIHDGILEICVLFFSTATHHTCTL
jgi:hypothetical protein